MVETAEARLQGQPRHPQHRIQKLYLQTELPSTFVAHVGSQTPWRFLIPHGA